MKLLIAVLLLIVTSPALADSRCDETDFRRIREAVREQLRCKEREIRKRDESCRVELPPCGRVLADELLEVLAGQASPGATRRAGKTEARCQRKALRAGTKYVRRRMRERVRGQRRASYASRIVSKVERACEGVVVGSELPSFGGACADLLVPGQPIPGTLLAHCLRASIERIIDDAAPEPLRPNVVIVLTDDQRPETLDFMPEVDRLGDQNVRFTNAFVTTAICTPSRASLYSGQYAHNHGSRTNQQVFDDSDTLAPWMSDAGYATGFFGKYRNDTVRGSHVPPGWSEWQAFNDPPDVPPRCPGGGNCFVDYFLNENGELVFYGDDDESYSTDLLARRTIEFIEDEKDAPFLAVYAPAPPHGPSLPARRHEGRFAGLPAWRPPNFGIAVSKPLWVLFFQRLFRAAGIAAIDERRIDELESLLAVDEAVRDILDVLERRGIRDNTLFLFTSDHGIHWGEHGWVSKLTPYEESIRVPFVLSYPTRAPVPMERPEMVLNIDIAPAIAAAADAETGPVDGLDFLQLLDGAASWRHSFLIENTLNFLVHPSDAVRTERWKYIETQAAAGVRYELYDLEADPYELRNVIADPDNRPMRRILERELSRLRES